MADHTTNAAVITWILEYKQTIICYKPATHQYNLSIIDYNLAILDYNLSILDSSPEIALKQCAELEAARTAPPPSSLSPSSCPEGLSTRRVTLEHAVQV